MVKVENTSTNIVVVWVFEKIREATVAVIIVIIEFINFITKAEPSILSVFSGSLLSFFSRMESITNNDVPAMLTKLIIKLSVP